MRNCIPPACLLYTSIKLLKCACTDLGNVYNACLDQLYHRAVVTELTVGEMCIRDSCFLVTLLGFIVSTVLLVIAILLFYGARKWYYYAIPLVMVGVVYYVFAVLLRISLP